MPQRHGRTLEDHTLKGVTSSNFVPLGFAPRLRVSKTPVTASTPWDIEITS